MEIIPIVEENQNEAKVDKKKPIIIKTSTDLQRLKLGKLMSNPVGWINQ